MEQITINKYQTFYTSVLDFVLKTNIAKKEDCVGINDVAILILEKELGCAFPLAIKTFFQYFGEKCNWQGLERCDKYTRENLMLAYRTSKEKDCAKIVYSLNNDLSDVFFFSYDSFRMSFNLCPVGIDNPPIKALFEYDELLDQAHSFTSLIRTQLFMLIKSTFYDLSYMKNSDNPFSQSRYKEIMKLDNSQLSWAEAHKKIQQGDRDNEKICLIDFDMYRNRLAFDEMINDKESKEDKILTIDEYELAFIDFIRKKYDFGL